jgi:hypothetical protein
MGKGGFALPLTYVNRVEKDKDLNGLFKNFAGRALEEFKSRRVSKGFARA